MLDSENKVNNNLSFLFKDSTLYGLAVVFNKLFQIITIPILTFYLSQKEFGIVDSLTILSFTFSLLIIFGQDFAIARYFHNTDDFESKKIIVSEGILISFFMSFLITTILFLKANFLSHFFFNSEQLIRVFRLIILMVPFLVLVLITQNLLKWTFSRNKYLIMMIGPVIANLILIIFNLAFFNKGLIGVFQAQFIGNIFFSFLGLYFCRVYIVFPKKMLYTKKLLLYGFPFVLVGIFDSLLPIIERYFIANKIGLSSLGVYGIGQKVAYSLTLIAVGFQMAWGPFVFSIYKEKEASEVYNKVFLYYSMIISIFVCLIIANSELLIIIFSSKVYLPATIFIPFLVFSLYLDSLSWITGIGINLSNKTLYNFLAYFISFLVSLFSISFLISYLGLLGVAIGSLIGKFFRSLLISFFAYKVYPSIVFKYKKPLSILFITIIFSIIIVKLKGLSIQYQIFTDTLILMTLLFIYTKFFISKNDYQLILKKVSFWK